MQDEFHNKAKMALEMAQALGFEGTKNALAGIIEDHETLTRVLQQHTPLEISSKYVH